MDTQGDEYQKGYSRAREGKETPDALWESVNFFRSEIDKKAREEGFKKAQAEKLLEQSGKV